MKKIILLFCILISTNAFADCKKQAEKSISCTSQTTTNLSNDDTNVWFCTENLNDIKSITIFVCNEDAKIQYMKYTTENTGNYDGIYFNEILQIMFYKDSQQKIDSFDSKTQTLYVGKSPTEAPSLLEPANPMVANTIYNRKDGRIHIGDKNNTSSHTDSETPATNEEIAIYSKVIEELNKQIQQIEDCVNDINVTGII